MQTRNRSLLKVYGIGEEHHNGGSRTPQLSFPLFWFFSWKYGRVPIVHFHRIRERFEKTKDYSSGYLNPYKLLFRVSLLAILDFRLISCCVGSFSPSSLCLIQDNPNLRCRLTFRGKFIDIYYLYRGDISNDI